MRRKRTSFLVIPAAIIAAAIALPTLSGSAASVKAVPTPESVLGWQPCTDYKLSNYDQIADYFRAMASATNRMKIVDLGKSSEGVDQIMAIISSPQNLTKGEPRQVLADLSRAVERQRPG